MSHDFLTDLIDRIVVAVHVAENPHKRESADWPGYNDLERYYLRTRAILLITNFHSLYSPDHSFVRSLAHSLVRDLREIDEEFIERNRGREA